MGQQHFRRAWAVAAVVATAACGDAGGVVGPAAEAEVHAVEGIVTAVGSRTVGIGPGETSNVPSLQIADVTESGINNYEVWYGQSIVRRAGGGETAPLVGGERVRVWTSTAVLYRATPIISADSVIVLD